MSLDALACIFATAPIRDCGRGPHGETVLASSWPLAVMFAFIVLLAIYAYARAVYAQPIDWDQEPAPKPLRRIEDIARDAGL